MATEVAMRQGFNESVSPGRKIRIGKACDDWRFAVAEQHAAGLAHRLDVRVAVVQHNSVRYRLRRRGSASHQSSRPTMTDRDVVKSEIASIWPLQYQPPRRVGMAQKSPGRTNAVDLGSNGYPGWRLI